MTRKRKILLPVVACLWLLLVSLGIPAVLAQQPTASGNNAQFIPPPSIPRRMQPGQRATVSITMKNTGTTTWTAAYRLGSQNPQDNLTWGLNRVYLAPGETIGPGQQKTFTFDIVAPTAPNSPMC